MMTTTVDQLIEETYFKNVTRDVNEKFTEAETAINGTLEGEEKDAALAALITLKARMVDVWYAKGIDSFKSQTVARIAGRGW